MLRLLAILLACSLVQQTCFLRAEEQNANFRDELPRISPLPVANALATMQLASGFRLEMVAHEPLVQDPVAMTFDEQGRLFVVEMRGYSERGDQGLGVVRLLTDNDGDGLFDHSTNYVDELSWPTAVCCYDGGIFVGVAPDILYCKDTDGDGRADIRERIFTGFGRSNVQGLLNSFRWGVDNRIHGATSSAGGAVRRPHEPQEAAVSLRGRDFSFDPATLDLRPESGGGQHGLSFDRWGRKFICSNSNHLRATILPDRYLVRNPYFALPSAVDSIAVDGRQAEVFRRSPVEPWRKVRTRLRVAGKVPGPVEGGGRASGYFTSATGVTIYTGDAWPEKYQQTSYAIVGDVGSNIVHRKRVEPKGVSFRADRVDQQHEFVASTDIWFRPVQYGHGPDGALYLADFHREVIEHPNSLPPTIKQHLDLNSGNDRGRIYRLVSDDYEYRQRLLPGDASTLQRVAMLEHPNGWHRLTAARLLTEHPENVIEEPLQRLVTNSSKPVARIHALRVLDSVRMLTADLILSALNDPHPRVREHAVELTERFAKDHDGLQKKLLEMTDDDDLRVRFQLALSLGEFHAAGTAAALAKLLLRDGEDPWVRAAVTTSSIHVVQPLLDQLTSSASWADSETGKSFNQQLQRIKQRVDREGGATRTGGPQVIAVRSTSTPLKHVAKKEEVIQRYRSALTMQGSAERGAKIFQKTCAACHDVNRNQGGIAPSVASFRNRGVEFMLTNVIDPNREVNPQYLSYAIQTVDGLTFAGMITGETATSITLRSGRDVKKTLLRIDIEEISNSGSSLMPENLEKEISEAQMADLFAYLMLQE
jgi:putative membrane-bound dehydrogenase-like protein